MNHTFPFDGKPGYEAAVQVAQRAREAVYEPTDALLWENLTATSYDLVLCLSQAWLGDPMGPQQARMVAGKVRAFIDIAAPDDHVALLRKLRAIVDEAYELQDLLEATRVLN